ncbi:MAG: endonuclease III [Elusimicrobia bacterium]|nr:endonuclease III [Elusimicrobiota bacterium]
MAFDRKRQAQAVLRGLRKLYPDAHCELDHSSPLELIVATILSAQCTDKRVNLVTPRLFKKYKTAAAFAAADDRTLEAEIRSTGFFRSKAASIKQMARALVERHGGLVPKTMEELLELRGVARKTANVVLGTAYGIPAGVVVDTHIRRVAYRLGLTGEKEPEKIERDLMAAVPKKDWIYFGHALIWHGRRVCRAAAPDCPGCLLNETCPKRGV